MKNMLFLLLSFNFMIAVGCGRTKKHPSSQLPSSAQVPIDHQHPELGTFNLRFFNESSANATSETPVFLFLCGEQACSSSLFQMQYLASLKTAYSAHIITLENRYYGKSQPFDLLTVENMKYLTIEQSLQDILMAKRQIQGALKLNGPWIVIGSSYPGLLAASLRARYPDEFSAAIASTPAVKFKAEFPEYDEFVASALSQSCLKNIQRLNNQIETLENLDELASVAQKVGLPSSSTTLDILDRISMFTAASVQYDYVDEFCSAMNDESLKLPLIDRLAKSKVKFNTMMGISENETACDQVDPKCSEGGYGERQWNYQACTEFGYFQTASKNRNRSARSKFIDLEYNLKLCQKDYPGTTLADSDSMNEIYFKPLQVSSVSNIFFSYGTNDPWNAVGMKENDSSNNEIAIFRIEGGHHAADLRYPFKSVTEYSPSMKATFKFIEKSTGIKGSYPISIE